MIYVIHLKNVEKLGLGPNFENDELEWIMRLSLNMFYDYKCVGKIMEKCKIYTNLSRLAQIR